MILPIRDTLPSHRIAWVTLAILLVNSVLFLYEVYLDPFSRNALVASWGLTPTRFRWETLISYMFLHGGWFHVVSNLWFLWIYGDNVEDVLGRGRYIFFYIACGVAAGLTQMAFNPDSRLPTVGASGALAGVMGAYLVKFPHARIHCLVFAFFLFSIEVPATLVLIIWFLAQVWSGVASIGDSRFGQGGVAWFAHIGGFLTGALLVWVLPTRRPYSHRDDLRW